MKVLIVDDCSSTCSLLRKYLAEWDFEPVVAQDGIQALEVLSEGIAPRMLIVDWMMPNMDGPTFIQEVRKLDLDRSNYIIMLTAKTGDTAVVSAFQFGADDYLAKPIDREELYCRLREGQNILERQDNVGRAMDELSSEAK